MIPRIQLTPDYSISRVIKGGWHLAGGHGAIDPPGAIADMARFVEAGITTFDCADIYTGVEELIGAFRRAYPSLATQIQIHTKYVPDLSALRSLTFTDVERGIDRSLRRLGVDRLDMVQFHWWDYAAPGYVETALALDRLRAAGKIAHVSVTNFDAPRLQEILDAGVRVLTHQVQYSLIDNRPALGMAGLCAKRDVSLLCYGALAGGFFSARWLGAAEPAGLTNRSLIKYKLIIDDFGGWGLFQALLGALDLIARARGASIAQVAARLVLERPAVAAVIIGATSAAHLDEHAGIFALALEPEDRAAADEVLAQRTGPHGDVYDLERDRQGPHGAIMKYELNG